MILLCEGNNHFAIKCDPKKLTAVKFRVTIKRFTVHRHKYSVNITWLYAEDLECVLNVIK